MRLQMKHRFTSLSILPCFFPPFELIGWCMNANPEHVKLSEQSIQIIRPTLCLDDVFNQ